MRMVRVREKVLRFFGADKLQNHTNEEKRKEKKKERGAKKEETKKQWLHSYFL